MLGGEIDSFYFVDTLVQSLAADCGEKTVSVDSVHDCPNDFVEIVACERISPAEIEHDIAGDPGDPVCIGVEIS